MKSNNTFKLTLSLLTIMGMTGPQVFAASCLPSAANGASVPFTMVTQQNYAGGSPYVSYVTGGLIASSSSSFFFHSTTFANSGIPQLFSNRYATPACGSQFCFATQPFDINQADQLGVSIVESSSVFTNPPSTSITVTLTLQSWGNGKESFAATCDATTGMLYGDLAGNTHVSIALGTPIIVN